MNIQNELLALKNEKHASFLAKLCPTVDINTILGLKSPQIKEIAKLVKNDETLMNKFLCELPHKYMEENMLHSFLLTYIKDFDKLIYSIEKFLPYIDNWAVCDSFNCKILSKKQNELLAYIKLWLSSKHTYTVRFATLCLMRYFLINDDFALLATELLANINTEDYYINMALAWFYCELAIKHYNISINIFESRTLPNWVQNKAIQKCVESFRLTDEQKTYLRILKIKA